MNKKCCRFCKKVGIPLMISCRFLHRIYFSCRPCQNKKQRKWYNKGNNYKKQQEYNKNYVKNNRV